MFTVGGLEPCAYNALSADTVRGRDWCMLSRVLPSNETRRRVANWAYRPPRDACCKSVAGFYFSEVM